MCSCSFLTTASVISCPVISGMAEELCNPHLIPWSKGRFGLSHSAHLQAPSWKLSSNSCPPPLQRALLMRPRIWHVFNQSVLSWGLASLGNVCILPFAGGFTFGANITVFLYIFSPEVVLNHLHSLYKINGLDCLQADVLSILCQKLQ